MKLTRRSFLKASIIIAAPAIVRAESIMKIWVPNADIIKPEARINIGFDYLFVENAGTIVTKLISGETVILNNIQPGLFPITGQDILKGTTASGITAFNFGDKRGHSIEPL